MASITFSTFSLPDWHCGGTTAKLRLYASHAWTDASLVPHVKGTTGSPTGFYQEVACTVSGTTLTVPAFLTPSTTDSLDYPTVTISGVLFDSKGTRRETLFKGWFINPTPSPLNWATFSVTNLGQGLVNPSITWLNAREVQALIDAQISNLNDPLTGRVVVANVYVGTDVGAQINAADADLGTDSGTILHFGGGNISTQIVVSENHTLRLSAGTYTATFAGTPFLMKSDTALIGEGWQTILQETTSSSGGPNNNRQVIANYAAYFSNGSTQRNMTIKDLQIFGARSDFNSAPQTVAMGNVHGCLIDHIYLNTTHTIGIQFGGAPTIGNDPLALGRYAENCIVRNCLFYKVASQNVAVVNGKSIYIVENQFKDPSQTGGPGITIIDCEINDPTNDRMENIIIANNLADCRSSALAPHGNFIAIQPGNSLSGPILVTGNVLRASFKTSNGIIMSSNCLDVTISNNYFQGCGQHGLQLSGTRINAANNTLVDCGTAGISTINIGCQQGRVYGNTHMAPILGNGTIDESVGANNNHVFNNNLQGNAPAILLVGAASRAWANIVGTGLVNDSFSVGASGTVINKILRGSVTINPASVAANTVASQTFTLTGAATGDSLTLNPPAAGLTAGLLVLQSFVSATDTITVVFFNTTGSPIDQASGTWTYQTTR